MNLIRFIWISRKIGGGFQLNLKFWFPWDRLLIGYAGADVEDQDDLHEISAFKGSLFIPFFELEFIRVKMADDYWEKYAD